MRFKAVHTMKMDTFSKSFLKLNRKLGGTNYQKLLTLINIVRQKKERSVTFINVKRGVCITSQKEENTKV